MLKKWFVFTAALLSAVQLAAQIPVIIPAGGLSGGDKTGLEELTSYLQKITGKPAQVLTEPAKASVPAIYYGATQFAAAQKIELSKFGEEEWVVRSAGKNLIVAGGAPRGNLFAAYHFLEDVAGVRWLSPYAEYVPSALPAWDKVNLTGKPAIAHRSIYLCPDRDGERFLIRNRMSPGSREYGGRLTFSHLSGREHLGSGHTLYSVLGDEKYIHNLYKEHPEYFPLIDGKRKFDITRGGGSSQSQFCLTNPELRKLWVSALRRHIGYDRELAKKRGVQPPMFYAVDQNDCFDGFCECPACDAIVKREDAKSGLMLDFTNYVASELKNDAPDAIFLMMALHSTEKAPKHMKAAANVGIRLCDTTSNMLYPWTDLVNAKHLKNLEDWAKISKYIYMWDYSISYGAPVCINYPFPSGRTFAADMAALAKNNGIGVFFEHEQVVGADMRDLKVWLEIKAAEAPAVPYEARLKDFTDHYYGVKAAPKIREYLALLEEAARKANASVTWFPTLNSFAYITPEVMIRSAKLFDEAYALAETKEQKNRVEYSRLSLDRLYLVRSASMKKNMEIMGKDPALLPDAQKVRERYLRIWKQFMALYPVTTQKAAYFQQEYSKNIPELMKLVELRKDLPCPPQFRHVKPDALFLYSSTLANVYVSYQHKVKDSESVAGEALRADMRDIVKCPHKGYGPEKYEYPFKSVIWPTCRGTVAGGILNPPKTMPKGYYWYKVADGVELNQKSVISPFAGFMIALDGAVSDNSELGQKYEVWLSIKVTGPDFFSTGKPTLDNVFYVDQAAVIRQTRHGEK